MKTKSVAPRNVAKSPRQPSLNGVSSTPASDVMTLGEAADFLRVAEKEIRKLAEAGRLPAKQFGGEWRILKSALCEWLSKPEPESERTYHERLLSMAGSMAHDDSALEMLENIYKERRKHPVSELQG